ncbi:hypothetical protein [Hyalangium versicolor]|uniref:hypothetical protein n=1 Tax=Hyalangium versicolor TaxID=2861190 RepID=UPI001CCCBD39|nr:hypothetical protein [Hyalangium versicolor]
MFRTARLPVLLLVAVGCGSPERAPPVVPGPSDAGEEPSYTAEVVASACDDLSSAEVLEFGTFTHVTDYTDLPFPFPLFGEGATRFVAAEQGLIFLGGSSLFVSTGGEPQQPPDMRIPNGWVAPFWDSLLTSLDNNSGGVRVLWTGTGADERFVMGYEGFTLRFPSDVTPNPNLHLRFQVALMRQSRAIEFRYCQLDPGPGPSEELRARVLGAAAEIGLESADGSLGFSYSFKAPLGSDGIAIRFTPVP